MTIISHDPPIKAWTRPFDLHDHEPLPCLIHSEDETDCVISEYDRKSKSFILFAGPNKPRDTVYADFEACRIAMVQAQAIKLEAAKANASNQASIYQHILSLTAKPYPDDAYETFTAKPETQEEETVQEEVKPAPFKRPSRRRIEL